jgi:hypothetical protein
MLELCTAYVKVCLETLILLFVHVNIPFEANQPWVFSSKSLNQFKLLQNLFTHMLHT